MKINYLYSVVLAVLSQASVADFSALDQQVKYFNDWAVACNNQRECFVNSLPPQSAQVSKADANVEDDSSLVYLNASRKATADSALVLNITDWDEEGGSLEEGQSIRLKVDQQNFDLGKVSAEAANNTSFQVPRQQTAEILAALQKGTQAELNLDDEKLQFNLQGFNEALQYFDEQQQRVDTPTALVKKGEKPFTATPPQLASITPVVSNDEELISDEERIKLQKQVHALAVVKDCLATVNKEEPYEDVIELLDKDHYLFGITCAADELNRQTLVLVAPKDKPEQAELAKFDQGVENAKVNGEFNGYSASEGILLNYYRKSEMGDCGGTAEWVWNGQSFVLSSYFSMPECRGSLNSLNVWKLEVNKPES